jgi:hypothetical protein
MGFGKGRPQTVLVAGRHDEVNRVRHEAPGPDLCARGLGGLADQVEIGSVVPVIEEDRLPVIASLGDVVRQARDNDARKSGRPGSSPGSRNSVAQDRGFVRRHRNPASADPLRPAAQSTSP